ncbi:MAG TPA: ABC transporter permease [Alphaproteobacteria bacterium]|nr:ABC transporter permease [Alphaproteobacteria bacterium]
MLGWQDVGRRYRRSTIGPFWVTISMGVTVGSLGLLYAALFQLDIRDYLPFLATGLIVWTFLSSVVLDGCQVFIASEGTIKQVRMPLSLHVFRMVWRNLIVLAHNLVILAFVLLFVGPLPGFEALLSLIGLAFCVLTGAWSALVTGLVCARFRDFPLIIGNLVQILFYVTPILWKPALLDHVPHRWVVELNPLFHFVAVVRGPLLGEVPSWHSWAVVLTVTAAGWGFSFLFFRAYRRRLPYWL